MLLRPPISLIEARDFTPWLLGHADQLAETLGIELELEQSERPVGGFSSDLVGRDLIRRLREFRL
jgi:hypothetical protein